MSEKISQITQIVATFAIVLSLVFLGNETRQNTVALQKETFNTFFEQGFELMLEPTRNELLLEAFRYYYQDKDNIPYPYSTVLNSYIVTTFRLLESSYLSVNKHTSDPVSETMYNNLLHEILMSDHNQNWWQNRRQAGLEHFDTEFVKFIDKWYATRQAQGNN